MERWKNVEFIYSLGIDGHQAGRFLIPMKAIIIIVLGALAQQGSLQQLRSQVGIVENEWINPNDDNYLTYLSQYGSIGTPSSQNWPGVRYWEASAFDSNQNCFYVFGGVGHYANNLEVGKSIHSAFCFC
jgi:hypothetical protein